MNLQRPRLLITGGSGFVGRRLVSLAWPNFEVGFTTFSRQLPGGHRLDLLDADATRALVHAFRPDVILHAAGSNDSSDMETTIVQGTENLSQAAKDVAARFVFMSTCVIFDGENGPYDESAPPSPINVYARAKVKAERMVSGLPDHLIVRTSLVYSLEEIDHSMDWLIEGLASGMPTTVFNDQLRNPIWVYSLTRALLELATAPVQGVLHVAGRQAMNRHQFALRQLDWFNVRQRESLRVGPCDRERWPADCRLDSSRAQSLLATPLLGVDDVLAAHGERQRL